ncbi:AbrB/MazE/SpoVT family DNA-binding domain-containing protein [Endothiovibrio diazotrophicus]
MHSSTLSPKGQVTVPSDLRTALDLHPGDQVEFSLEGDHAVLRKRGGDIRKAFGVIKAQRGVSLEEMERAIRQRGGE